MPRMQSNLHFGEIVLLTICVVSPCVFTQDTQTKEHMQHFDCSRFETAPSHHTEGFQNADKNRESEHAGRLECMDERVVR